MDRTEAALALLDCLERNDIDGLEQRAVELRRTHVELGRDGMDLIDRALALERWPALRPLLMLAASDHPDMLFGIYAYDFLAVRAQRCLQSEQMRAFLEMLALGAPLPELEQDDVGVERIAQMALYEFSLDDERVIAITRACRGYRGAFLVRALRIGRMDLVQKLAPLCMIRQDFGANRIIDVPLIVAAEVGATAALRAIVAAGAKPNVALRGSGYPLHYAVCCAHLDGADRCELVHELLRLGAVPELRDADGLNAYALAESRHDAGVLAVLREYGFAYGPRQAREARHHDVRDVRLLYDKADGLIYRIGQPDVPFLEGGDYDGIGPCSIAHFREAFEQIRKRRGETSLDWFEPFLARLERGQEFEFDEFRKRAAGIEFRGFNETSNWSQMVD